jgi:hypothetical protein
VGSHHRIRALVTVAALFAATTACKRQKTPDVTAPAVASAPADRLAPGEAAPGQEKAHDLLLPRGGKIEREFGKSIYAWVPLSPEAVASYIRTQADEADAVIGANGTVIPKLRVKGAFPDHWLRVEISTGARTDETLLVIDRVDDINPVPTGKSNVELMKEVGLNPDGTPIDPKHVE